ncbi:hypothetical protein FJT64_003273 [Amphibalanus amphitrite]|uniref:PKD domain-containing protein n=1 Tax=Amphibalanus amphitrite TaxID=1232801 RepID=A0A6A4WAG5_AMPAM|nr:hypothetical protein FJT64_003273 [Amphibalanus amphitrite]
MVGRSIRSRLDLLHPDMRKGVTEHQVKQKEFMTARYDFGDGSDATKPKPADEATTVTYQYRLPGTYTVTAIFTDVPGVAKPRYHQTTVTVSEEVGQLELDCPDLSEPGDEISCQLWLTTGSQLSLTVEMDQGFTDGVTYALADPYVRGLGQTPPQHPTTLLKTGAPSFHLGDHSAPLLSGRRSKRSL